MKALVIDDARCVRSVSRKILTGLGYEVSEAKNGQEALTYLKAHPDVALAVIDWNMPVMNGLQLVQAVHADPELSAVRMMMVTTEIEMAQMARALEAGAHEYLMKPFTKSAMRAKLEIMGLPSDPEVAA